VRQLLWPRRRAALASRGVPVIEAPAMKTEARANLLFGRR
jgi:hypothetical protein